MVSQLIIIKYKDITSTPETLNPIYKFCGVTSVSNSNSYSHRNSVAKWKCDKFFGFNLATEVEDLALIYGYKSEELLNQSTRLWPIYRNISDVSLQNNCFN